MIGRGTRLLACMSKFVAARKMNQPVSGQSRRPARPRRPVPATQPPPKKTPNNFVLCFYRATCISNHLTLGLVTTQPSASGYKNCSFLFQNSASINRLHPSTRITRATTVLPAQGRSSAPPTSITRRRCFTWSESQVMSQ